MANSMITIDAAHQGSHCLAENDWFCLAGSSMYVAESLLLSSVGVCECVCVCVCVCVGGDESRGSVGEVVSWLILLFARCLSLLGPFSAQG